jgi:hypothetical protein
MRAHSKQIKIIEFPVNKWEHLYSLEQAFLRNKQATGKNLTIIGALKNQSILNNHATPVYITFSQVDGYPAYDKTENEQIILGQIKRLDNKLESTLFVDRNVFEELRKNLMEYADIDGIHIVVTIGFTSTQQDWPIGTEYSIVKLDYAMKGDS